MMILKFPKGFVPEQHGWQVTHPMIPHQQHEMAMYELHRFGFVSTHFIRWSIPFQLPFTLVFMGYKADTGCYWGMYGRPFEWPDGEVTKAQVIEEILNGPSSPERPFVSLPGK